jgi:hypothetical protein
MRLFEIGSVFRLPSGNTVRVRALFGEGHVTCVYIEVQGLGVRVGDELCLRPQFLIDILRRQAREA